MELCSGTLFDLGKFVQSRTPKEEDAADWYNKLDRMSMGLLRQICLGGRHLEERGYAHLYVMSLNNLTSKCEYW